jgi:hypothetical protein
MKLVVYIMAPNFISAAYFIDPIILHLYVYPPIVARPRLGMNVTAATNARNNRRIDGLVLCMRFVTYQRNVGD